MSIGEILKLDTPKRSRIVGIVVSIHSNEFMINDGTGQLSVDMGEFRVEIGKFYRVLLNARDEGRFEAFAVHSIAESDVEKYRKVVGLERRVKRRWQ